MKACLKLSEAEARVATATQEGVEAYKATKQCHDELINYSTMTCFVGKKNEIRSKVAIRFPGLDLTFLNMDSEEDGNESTLGPEASTNPPTAANTLPTA